jgi:hypothetical protein
MQPISTGRREFLQVAGVLAVATASTGILCAEGGCSAGALFDWNGATKAQGASQCL